MAKVWWRAIAVVLLVAGATGGVYLGSERETAQETVAVDETLLIKERHARQVAARSFRTAAEDQAATKASAEVKVAAGQARTLEKKRKEKKAAADVEKTTGSVPFDGPIPDSCDEFKGNRATGCALMLAKGFKIAEFPCLNNLWNKESGWNHLAENKGSGAYGIPQALPGKKMASVADDWRINAATQIKWGLGYIKGRYKTPCGAWRNFQNNGNY
ncbi:lytic transglycosylase domain-containing protein [Actinoplanes sp. GCM10030250]|uniref:aggregation-promoting factor C-terminal-like domain-containing protein n=1 Tax=Actinoplanes sp. GCM10030250 TaxID=3273376 RepID=UPI00361527EB